MYRELGRATFEQDAHAIRPLLKKPTTVESWEAAASVYLGLPGLRGYWPLTAINGANNYVDISGGGLTLTNTNTVYVTGDNALRSYSRFTLASSTYLNRADEAAFDITGAAEAVSAAYAGLTVGAWVNMVTLPSAYQTIASKWGAAGTRSYLLNVNSSNRFEFAVSGNGTAAFYATSTVNAALSTWYFVAGRYQVATPEINLWVNATEYTNTTSIPASLFNGAAAFILGCTHDALYFLNANMCHAFLCAAALPDAVIGAIYNRTKGLLE